MSVLQDKQLATYYELGKQMSQYKTQRDGLKDSIKNDIGDTLGKYETANFRLNYYEMDKSAVDEPAAIEYIQELIAEILREEDESNLDTAAALSACLLKKVTLDQDKLEELAYQGVIDAAAFAAKCVIPKFSRVMRVTAKPTINPSEL